MSDLLNSMRLKASIQFIIYNIKEYDSIIKFMILQWRGFA